MATAPSPATTAMRDVYVDANGLRHHLTVRGAPGTPIVMMVHGLTQQAHAFDGVASRLAAHFHVYCLDVRGRGETEWGPPDGYHTGNYVEDLEAVRASLGIERFALVGTSMGGLIGIQYTPSYPERVSKLVINDIGPDLDPAGRDRILGMLTSAPQAFTDMKAVVKYYRESNAPMMGQRSDEEVYEYARWHVRKNDISVYAWKMDPAVRTAPPPPPLPRTMWDAYNAITCPILLVRGAATDVLSAETAQKMATHPQTRLVEVPNIGHAPALTEDAVYPELERFLGEG
jgi:pimeloyl-ACP methyl ester carboxylesterase